MIFARWVLYLGALGLVGAFGAALLTRRINSHAVAAALTSSIAVAIAVCAIFAVQRYVWFGGEGITQWDNAWLIVSSTVWGKHWTWLAVVAAVAVVMLPLARRRLTWWIAATGAISLALAAVAPLIGHAGSHDATIRLLHGVHLLGGGLWLGSLGMTVIAGINDRRQLLGTLRRFAPLAFGGAVVVAATGVLIAWEHLDPISALWTSPYGRVLSAKVAAVLIVAGLGFVNWRQPRIAIVLTELTLALTVVLGLAAWLSELPIARMRSH